MLIENQNKVYSKPIRPLPREKERKIVLTHRNFDGFGFGYHEATMKDTLKLLNHNPDKSIILFIY